MLVNILKNSDDIEGNFLKFEIIAIRPGKTYTARLIKVLRDTLKEFRF